jgi:hypothetical protein
MTISSPSDYYLKIENLNHGEAKGTKINKI